MRLAVLTAIALVLPAPALAQERHPVRPPSAFAPLLKSAPAIARSTAPTAKEAADFIAQVERDLQQENIYASRVEWVAETYINDDTDWLAAKLYAEVDARGVLRAKQAATFNGVDVDPATRRKLEILKTSLWLPPPVRPGAGEELADIEVKLGTIFSTSKVEHNGKQFTLDDIEDAVRTLRDPAELRALWEGWHAIARPMAAPYARMVALGNEGARELGYPEIGVLWRSGYDMPPEQFAASVERLWRQVEPMYKNLHCYARARLNEKYGDTVQPRTGPIRVDLLGNIYGLTWANVFDLVAPKNASLPYDLTDALKRKGYDEVKLVKTAENFYTSIGFAPLPETFWQRSLLSRPRDREVNCHASAWDIDGKDDLRVKACLRVNADDFYTAHHELGHNMYYRAYKDQPALFQNGANDGFHEAIGDFIGLSSVTPSYLKEIGLIDQVPGADNDIAFLLRMALDKLAFLPWGLVVDKWRWQVFSGETPPERYNSDWWALRLKYQGVVPPAPRPADAFDPGAKSHIADGTPYMRYFLALVYQFQFQRAACRIAGAVGPLNRCSIYGNKEVGKRFQAMLQMGASKPWPEALAAFTGERDIDAGAIVEYFTPLDRWLAEQNKGEKCGW